jgi:diguanylate cyclase (GGDEF)-like protein
MISLKKYLDDGNHRPASDAVAELSFQKLLSAYRAGMKQMGECGREISADLAVDFVRGIERLSETLKANSSPEAIASSESALREAIRTWCDRVTEHQGQRAKDVKDLLLVMSRTAESLGLKDDRFARRLDDLTLKLTSITTLDDLARIRSSIELNARDLKLAVEKMAAESKLLIEHLRLELTMYQAKLEKAEQIASRDTLTGLGSRHWIECCIQDRIETGSPFSIVLIDIDDFSDVVESYGNLVSDMLLKEFARELRCACRFTDLVGRWGGDEFIILPENSGPEIQPQVSRLRAWVSKPYHVPDQSTFANIRLTASTGVAEYIPGDDIMALMERADVQLCKQREYREEQKSA